MPDLYPTDKEITIFGEKVKYPGLDQNGKFTNGSFTDPKQLASFIPAETLNLILDNLGEAIKSVGLEPNNIDTDQLAKALNIRTKNNIIQQEILEKLVVFNIDDDNAPTTLTPDENGIIYSQDINLKKSLSEKIGRKEEDIEIINFNLIPAPPYKPEAGGIVGSSFFGNSAPDRDELNLDKFVLSFTSSEKIPFMKYQLWIQVADDFTEDITNYTPSLRYKNFIQDSIKYKASILNVSVDAQAFSNKYSCHAVAELFGSSLIHISLAQKLTQSVDMSVSNYFYSIILKDLNNSPEVNVENVANYDVSSKLLYGDNIKIRIKLFAGESIMAYVYKVFDVAVRYKIINK